MIVKILGSAAGGGFPQWNCNGRNCRDVRAGREGLAARTQSSIAVSVDGSAWAVVNASPDIRQQINATPELQPRPDGDFRNSPIKAVILTNGDVDHVAGLLSLREGQPFTLYASARVLDAIGRNVIFDVLDRETVPRVPMVLGAPFAARGAGTELGLTVEAFAVPGKVALYLEDAGDGENWGTREGDTVGLRVSDANGASFFYIPGCAALDDALTRRLTGAGTVLFDGTLFTDDEMVAQNLSRKTGARMGHMAMAGPEGSLAAFAALAVERPIYVHLNNSNPVLRADSAERAQVEAAGWEVAYDGMELHLT